MPTFNVRGFLEHSRTEHRRRAVFYAISATAVIGVLCAAWQISTNSCERGVPGVGPSSVLDRKLDIGRYAGTRICWQNVRRQYDLGMVDLVYVGRALVYVSLVFSIMSALSYTRLFAEAVEAKNAKGHRGAG